MVSKQYGMAVLQQAYTDYVHVGDGQALHMVLWYLAECEPNIKDMLHKEYGVEPTASPQDVTVLISQQGRQAKKTYDIRGEGALTPN